MPTGMQNDRHGAVFRTYGYSAAYPDDGRHRLLVCGQKRRLLLAGWPLLRCAACGSRTGQYKRVLEY